MEIDVLPMGPHEYAVNVTEGHQTTAHRAVVPDDLLDALGPVDEQRVVRASFQIFLDRKKASTLPHDVSLGWIADTIADFNEELEARIR